MESSTNTPKPDGLKQEPKRSVPMYLIAAIITLSVVVVILIALNIKGDRENDAAIAESETNKAYILKQKGGLESELNQLIVSYDSLILQSDSLASQLSAEQERIRSLLKSNASSVSKIRMYEKELGTLRSIMRSYVVQIDSLNMRNLALTEENIQYQGRNLQLTEELEMTQQERDQYSQTVSMAKKLIAENVKALGYKQKQAEKQKNPQKKSKNVDIIRIDFTLIENHVAEPGIRTIYLRILDQNDKLLPAASNRKGSFEYQGELLEYSEKQENVQYENMKVPVTIYWNKTVDLSAQDYFVELYCEGHQIGSTILSFKK